MLPEPVRNTYRHLQVQVDRKNPRVEVGIRGVSGERKAMDKRELMQIRNIIREIKCRRGNLTKRNMR